MMTAGGRRKAVYKQMLTNEDRILIMWLQQELTNEIRIKTIWNGTWRTDKEDMDRDHLIDIIRSVKQLRQEFVDDG